MMSHYNQPIENFSVRNTVGLIGIDQFLLKSRALTASQAVCNMRAMKFSVSPVVQVTIKVRNAADLPKLVESLRRLEA